MIFGGVGCEACGEILPENALDEDGWCDACRPRQRRRMSRGRHLIATAVTLPFAIWILRLDKAEFLPRAMWLLPLAAAYYLGFRIGGEVMKGHTRWKHTR